MVCTFSFFPVYFQDYLILNCLYYLITYNGMNTNSINLLKNKKK